MTSSCPAPSPSVSCPVPLPTLKDLSNPNTQTAGLFEALRQLPRVPSTISGWFLSVTSALRLCVSSLGRHGCLLPAGCPPTLPTCLLPSPELQFLCPHGLSQDRSLAGCPSTLKLPGLSVSGGTSVPSRGPRRVHSRVCGACKPQPGAPAIPPGLSLHPAGEPQGKAHSIPWHPKGPGPPNGPSITFTQGHANIRLWCVWAAVAGTYFGTIHCPTRALSDVIDF